MKNKPTKKPIIGITTSLLPITEAPFLNHQRVYVNRGYVDAISKAGGVPLLLPVNSDKDAAIQLLSLVDGILFSGGYDIHPSLYSEEPHPLLGQTFKERDEFELFLFQSATNLKNIPILGVCRGLQLINVACGGTLYQDLSLCKTSMPAFHKSDAMHRVELKSQTKLENIFQSTTVMTNSHHHQAIKELASDFTAIATAEDGTIEGIERNNHFWTVGVQWHPEVMVSSDQEMLPLFKAFVEAAK